MSAMTVTRIIVNAPGIVARAKKLRSARTKEIRKLKADDPGIEGRVGTHANWELTVHREVLHAVRWVLFGGVR
jgi:hypothetical protein